MTQAKRIAVVTGASAGIGRATVEKLLSAGFYVVGNARRVERLESMASDAYERFGETRFVGVPGDINDAGTVKRLIDVCQEYFDEMPNTFVINAGRGLPGSILGSDEALWQQLYEVNCLSALTQMRAAANAMIARSERSTDSPVAQDIIIIGSIVGRHLSPVNPVYGSTKFAVNSLAEALRREVCSHWIRVTLIEPGTVETEFQEVAGYDPESFAEYGRQVGPFVTGDDIANFIHFAVSQPIHVHFNNVVIRPTRQPYP